MPATAGSGAGVDGLRAVSFDFGNTLVPVRRKDLRIVVERTTGAVADRCGPFDRGAFAAAWAEERERQFAEDVPAMREVDLTQRVARVLARMRGMPAPGREDRWDDPAAARLSTADEIDFAVDVYSAAFVESLPPPPEVGPLLARLADRYVLGICSNWPLAATIERYVHAAGWAAHLRAVVVSQRVGTIKPDPRIFRVAESELGVVGPAVLHVGDDWAADVVGAKAVGWRVAYLRLRPVDSPLPSSPEGDDVRPDLVIDRLGDLEELLGGSDPAGRIA
jgi:HAD superfamily hydrolase (TIGR01509 family)